MPQDLVEIQMEQPEKEDDYQEYTELENLDGFKLEMHSVSLKVRDIQVWQPSIAPALVSLAGEKYTQAIMISSKKYRVMHLKNVIYQSQITISESQ